jgi:hypothetical protein
VRSWRRLVCGRGSHEGPGSPSPLDAIGESTPHRYRVWLAEGRDLDRARDTLLDTGRARPVGASTDPDRGVVVEVESDFQTRSGAMIGPLYRLRQASVVVAGLEALDVIEELSERHLREAVEAWGRFANNGPYRARLERLGGMPILESCLRAYLRDPRGRGRPYHFAAAEAAFNTPGSEGRLIEMAVAMDRRSLTDDRLALEAQTWLGPAYTRAWLSDLAGMPSTIPEATLLPLIDRPGLTGRGAVRLARYLPRPLSESATRAVCGAVGKDEEQASEALVTLRHAAPTADLRAVVEQALRAESGNVRAEALGLLAHKWGTEARPVWREFLAARSPTVRMAAEHILGRCGTEADLPDAAVRLGQIVRAKAGAVSYSPPRGAELVDLLARHRSHPAARKGLDDLSARWDSLDDDMRAWLRAEHAWLDPASRDDRPAEQVVEPLGPVEWPLPKIEVMDGGFYVEFREESAWSTTRDRFEALVRAHPQIELLGADREFLELRIGGDEPRRLLEGLWAAAGERDG